MRVKRKRYPAEENDAVAAAVADLDDADGGDDLQSEVAETKVKGEEVHPCGQYRKNTVVGILQAEHGLASLFPIHRLDRLVSGLLILATSASKADLFRQQIEAGMVEKQYVAKVIGVFPEDEQVVNANVNYNAREGRSTTEVESVENGSTALKGKAACTKFTRISTNGTHSIILCEPITGRTHQIRVHLQYMGHPIANDMLYLSEVTDRSTKGMCADRAAAKSAQSLPSNPDKDCSAGSEENSKEDFSIDPMCTNCPNLAPKGIVTTKKVDYRESLLGMLCSYDVHLSTKSKIVALNAIEVLQRKIDMMGMRKVYGCIVFDILDPTGLTNTCKKRIAFTILDRVYSQISTNHRVRGPHPLRIERTVELSPRVN
ncbi:hypothetical protein TEA_030087 [Camellia sinensis var. sinensis]|uniref:Pseudouridine synthase RsuA/RluA-like domain-containing protein n=1 Tax=Camellia sinensis var. sinensis TaxID=542762 RepID=A0A4S4DRU1_CAMSN|nr:hypothetical protein TEA_030087 [Camellia sinensis var. sinensis]